MMYFQSCWRKPAHVRKKWAAEWTQMLFGINLFKFLIVLFAAGSFLS